MNQKFRIVLVEDHAIIREGLKSLLASSREYEIVGEAENGFDALRIIEKLKPDLVVTDLSMPRMSGVDLIQSIKKKSRKVKIIALTVHKNEEYVLATLKAGADGYVLKEASYSELMLAMKNVLKGNYYLSPGISGKLIDGYLAGEKSSRPLSIWETLTRREREILKLIGEGRTNKEIATLLFISVNTVEKHRSNLMSKLDLHSTAALIAFAMEKGLAEKR